MGSVVENGHKYIMDINTRHQEQQLCTKIKLLKILGKIFKRDFPKKTIRRTLTKMFIQNHVDNLTPLREASEVDYGDGVDNGDIFQI